MSGLHISKTEILKLLEGEKVFSVKKVLQGYQFTEECDEYFTTTLNQEQMESLIKELQFLAGIETEK